jgi:hypothetical protein
MAMRQRSGNMSLRVKLVDAYIILSGAQTDSDRDGLAHIGDDMLDFLQRNPLRLSHLADILVAHSRFSNKRSCATQVECSLRICASGEMLLL